MNNSDVDLYELHWSNHSKILKGTFDIFRNDNELVDVTLSCEGKKLKAHKIVLSACSLYFLDLFRDNPCQHPIIILRDIKYEAMVNILNFMYTGEVNIAMEHLNSFLKIAESLQVKGLAVEISQGKNLPTTTDLNSSPVESSKIKRNLVNNDAHNVTSISPPKILKMSKKHSNIEKNINETNKFSNCDSQKEILLKENQSDSDCMLEEVQSERISTNELTEKSLKDFTKTKKKYAEDSFNTSSESVPLDHLKTEIIDVDIFTDDSEFGAADASLSEPDYSFAYFTTDYNDQLPASVSKTYPCPHCQKVFNHYISLKLHLPRHSGDTCCTICNAVLSRKYDLKVHMRRKHNIDMDEYYKRNQSQHDITTLE